MTFFRSDVPGRKHAVLSLSPWLLVGLAVILGAAVAILAVRNTQRDKRHMSENLTARAGALIWALEAGTKTKMGKHGGSEHLQSLLEETAKQPGIAFMAVTDESGVVLAHSDTSRIGDTLYDSDVMQSLQVSDFPKWRLVDVPDGTRVFEVYKKFSPVPGFKRNKERAPSDAGGDSGTGRPGGRPPGGEGTMPGYRPIIFVGMDVKPFEEALADDDRNTVLVALLVALLGVGGFISLFWAHNYRLSRRQLQDTQAFASEVVTNLPVGLLTSDADGLITMVNAAALEMLGVGRDGLMRRPLRDTGGLDWQAIFDSLAGKTTLIEQEHELLTRAGRTTPVGLSASRIVNEEGVFLGHLFILRDLGEVKRLQEHVRRNERLSALGNLAAGVAHEIRNPLSSIKGFATYLSGKVKDEGPDTEVAKMMVQEVDRLNRVVSELLEFARPSGMRFKRANVNDVVEKALRLAGSDAAAKGIAPSFSRDDALPLVPVDAERLTQALLNVFLNAIQASEPGGALAASVFVDRESDSLALRIADAGRGISPSALSMIFNPYYTTKPSGTGLGLTIVHQIVEGHGGEIKIESQPGKGTVFTLLLPLDRPAEGPS